jgi:hypothetical protein
MKTRTTSFLALLLLVGSMHSCKEKSVGVSQVYEGRYVFGFEASNFEPCEYDGIWWLDGNLNEVWKFVESHPEVFPNKSMHASGEVFLRCQATLSAKGHYGHLGGRERQLNVEKILLVRTVSNNDCKPEK